jgi:MFS family permease
VVPQHVVVPRSSPGWALALTAMAFFMVSLDLLVVLTALPVMQRELHAGLAALEWTVNAYSLASAAGIITAAALGDRFGRRRVFTVGLALFTLASAACGLAPTVSFLIAARAVQGIGAALVTPTALTILVSAFLIAQYLQVALGNSPLQAGLRFLPMTAMPLVVAPLAGTQSDRIGQRPVMVTGLLLLAVGLGWLALAAATGVGYVRLVLPLLTAGIGVSMAFATTPTAVMSAVAPADLGKASGATNTLQRFGGVFGIAIATAVFFANGHLGTPAGFDAGFHPALLLAAGLAVLGALSALAVGPRRPLPATRPAGASPTARPEASVAVALQH